MARDPRPTQIKAPRRTTIRTVIVAGLALLPVLPEAAEAAGINEVPAVALFLVTTAAIQRVLILPSVDNWLRNYIPWLSAEQRDPAHRLTRKTPTDDYAPNRIARATERAREITDDHRPSDSLE